MARWWPRAKRVLSGRHVCCATSLITQRACCFNPTNTEMLLNWYLFKAYMFCLLYVILRHLLFRLHRLAGFYSKYLKDTDKNTWRALFKMANNTTNSIWLRFCQFTVLRIKIKGHTFPERLSGKMSLTSEDESVFHQLSFRALRQNGSGRSRTPFRGRYRVKELGGRCLIWSQDWIHLLPSTDIPLSASLFLLHKLFQTVC